MSEAEQTIRYPELPPTISRGLNWRALGYFGAGAIIASVTIGSGETFFASRGGAIFGYAVLWFLAVSAIAKGVMVYTGARHFTLTGTHPMTHWGNIPGPKNWVPWMFAIISLLCFPFWIAGLPIFLATAMNWMFESFNSGAAEIPVRTWGVLLILLAAGLTLVQTYRALETFQTVVVATLLVSMLAAALVCKPDWLEVIKGLLLPSFPDYPDWFVEQETAKEKTLLPAWAEIGIYLGAIGGGTYDYLGYLSFYREKKWGLIGEGDGPNTEEISVDAENTRRGKRWLFPAKMDVGIAFLCVLIFTICFTVLGATVLGTQQKVPSNEEALSLQAEFLTQIHPKLMYLYMIGIFMAFWGTIYGAFEIYIRTARECLMPLSKTVRAMKPKVFSRWIVAYCAIGGIILMFLFEKPTDMVKPAAIIGGVFLCGPWCFAMIWADRKYIPKTLRMGPVLLILNVVAGSLLTILGVQAIWNNYGHLLTGG